MSETSHLKRQDLLFTLDNRHILSILHSFVLHKAVCAVNIQCLHAIDINVYLLN